MKREEKAFGALFGGFLFLWVLSVLASVAGTGLIIYILWRIATHPW